MLSRKTVFVIAPCIFALGVLCAAVEVFPRASAGMVVLSGSVHGAEGNTLDGIGVSAREDGKTFTTTVYTDQSGVFAFPEMESGHYKIWAQAEGFGASVKELDLNGPNGQHADFTLAKLSDFQKQLSGPELMASLPGDSPADNRMKAIFLNNCTGCHPANFTLQNRFDKAGWTAILDTMMKVTPLGNFPKTGPMGEESDKAQAYILQAYKDELVAYLTRVRGPDSTLADIHLLPRPSGDAAHAVITEFDLPRPDKPAGWVLPHNGSDWSEGTPSRYEGRSAHDVVIDRQGIVWFVDDVVPDRSLGKLDPRTGRVTDYILRGPAGSPDSLHAAVIDRAGNIWAANLSEGMPTEFDAETSKFTTFPRPANVPSAGGFIAVDSKDNIWAPYNDGAVKLDPRTGRYTIYQAITTGKGTYGIDVDREDNVWIAQPGADRVMVVDGKTGKVGEIVVPPLNEPSLEVTSEDRDLYSGPIDGTSNAPPQQKGPRRLAADKNGDSVWVSEYFADRLLRIDIHTRKITEYPFPHPYVQPYAVAVDKDHMVWISLLNADRIAKFDPVKEKFTEYELPTRGTENRHIAVDNRTTPPSVWVPYGRTNKLARIEFRPQAESGN